MGSASGVTRYYAGHLIQPFHGLWTCRRHEFWVLVLFEGDLNPNTYVTKAILSICAADILLGGIPLH